MSILLATFLSTSLLFWSDRDKFSDPEKISDRTVQLGSEKDQEIDFTQFQDGRVLFLAHGYNNTADEAIETYSKIFQFIADASENETYTHVIGYLWPGYDDEIEYFDAKESVERLILRMKGNLERLSTSAYTVDVLAHSMGNRLILESLLKLSLEKKEKAIYNFYSFAAAVDDESIEKKQTYYPATELCQKMFIFHSKNDKALRFGYRLAEGDVALGSDDDIQFSQIPENVQFIDCTPLVSGHSAYFDKKAFPIFRFICNEKIRALYPYELVGKNLTFAIDGSIIALSE